MDWNQQQPSYVVQAVLPQPVYEGQHDYYYQQQQQQQQQLQYRGVPVSPAPYIQQIFPATIASPAESVRAAVVPNGAFNAETIVKLSKASVKEGLEEGVEHFINRVKPRFPDISQIEIRFKDLSYTAEITVRNSTIETVGSSFLRMLMPFKPKETFQRQVLNKLNGILRPGTLTLVLGLPMSGKSSLLKALSDTIYIDGKSKLSGEVLVNGEHYAGSLTMRRISSYVEQRETLLPVLTVRETLDFARNCLLKKHEDYEDLHDVRTEIILHLVGLHHTADTLVGNELIRGISGGEKRRVTLSEMLTGPQRFLCLDEISTGLDSAATFDIINTLRLQARVFGHVCLISLLQPLPDTFELFDDIILMAKGNIIYHGPVQQAEQYFSDLGYTRPLEQDLADYLLEVTGEAGRKYYRHGADQALSVEALTDAWHSHPLYQQTLQTLAQPTSMPPINDENSLRQFSQEFALSSVKATIECLKRQIILTRRNVPFLRAKFGQGLIMALLTGSLFYQMPADNFQLRYGYIFFSVLIVCFSHIAAIPDVMLQKDVFFKQRRANFFEIAPFIVSSAIVEVPFVLLETLLFSSVSYWMAGLSSSDSGVHFAIFWLILVFSSLTVSNMYRLIAYLMSSPEMAHTVAGLATVIGAVFAGFMIPNSEIPDWWIWVYYSTPFSWALRALVINEFMSSKFNLVLPSGLTQGQVYLQAFDFASNKNWIWIAFIALAGFYLLLISLSYLALRFSSYGKPNDVEVRQKATAMPLELPTVNLPFQPVALSFYDLSYSVTVKGEQLMLLKGVSGFAEPGKITALMGSSGAGKTTLLDVLAGRKNVGTIGGKILINGYPKKDISFSRIAGYVEQMDVHTSTTTVREALLFSANLRLPSSVPKDQISAFVDQVLQILELGPIAHCIVGDKHTGGLSVEQAKRLTIGVELVANPSILFLDEPTSGLDSRAAAIVMRAIRNISNTGRSVVCTIHQPSTELFSMFDRLLLLKRGGEVVYFGDLGENSSTLINYFESIPGSPKYVPHSNPASYMLETIGAGIGNVASADYVAEYAKSAMAIENKQVLDRLLTPPPGVPELHFEHRFARTIAYQFYALLVKKMTSYWRMPGYNLVRPIFVTVLALLFGSLYYKNDPTTQQGAFARISVIFISTLFIGVVNLNTIASVMMSQRGVFYREKAAAMYSPAVYDLTSGIVEIPYQTFNSLLFLTIFYWMVGFKASAENFFYYWICFLCFTLMATYFGQFLAAFAPNENVAHAVAPLFISVWNLFCGYMTPHPQIPNYWIWLYWLSPFRYLLEGLATDQFHCDSTQCFSVTTVDSLGNPIQLTGDQFLEQSFGMTHDNKYYNLLALFGFLILFRFLAMYCVVKLNHSTR